MGPKSAVASLHRKVLIIERTFDNVQARVKPGTAESGAMRWSAATTVPKRYRGIAPSLTKFDIAPPNRYERSGSHPPGSEMGPALC